jgi:hypothetical protein
METETSLSLSKKWNKERWIVSLETKLSADIEELTAFLPLLLNSKDRGPVICLRKITRTSRGGSNLYLRNLLLNLYIHGNSNLSPNSRECNIPPIRKVHTSSRRPWTPFRGLPSLHLARCTSVWPWGTLRDIVQRRPIDVLYKYISKSGLSVTICPTAPFAVLFPKEIFPPCQIIWRFDFFRYIVFIYI